ncbi:MAG: helix-turn-helix transcriptional regulator [Candidatus Fluviicola riflensis]|nr:MAG: helix-turn-helix transcriptional regulator [Candidatus Fluviicola riflensis]OGS77157.1 MAG: helix-turn-helix transcriptional regulator [Candidatus Fluviicola riflensis]OGS82092.1 MAG: helix-turn-helix transcriptional regulator [Fluviicola sp. RIFCSPHIGHO2_01_FULL_43_53]OGS87786.1 MAG: helix-turn-helix transcriptional regulator [Fluviicola sp. RIFCSPHIGHO2_12_FULL_43_24]
MRIFLKQYRTILLTGVSLAGMLVLLRWLELRFLILDNAIEVYIGAIAILFTGLGIWLALKLTKPKTVIVEREIFISPVADFQLNETTLNELGISKRELEVLELMAQGCSNQEIANRLFVSLNTVKTHSSRLFEKLDVSRRTQAIEKGKRLLLIP